MLLRGWGWGGVSNGCLFYGPPGSRPVAVLPKGRTRDLVNIVGLYYKDVNKGVSLQLYLIQLYSKLAILKRCAHTVGRTTW